MLQAYEHNQSIRHGTVAIAALDMTSQLTRERIWNSGAITSEPGGHYQFALQQYSLAIRHMQNETSKGEPDLATTLITCIVIVCFETFHGNNDSAVNQTTTGYPIKERPNKKKKKKKKKLIKN